MEYWPDEFWLIAHRGPRCSRLRWNRFRFWMFVTSAWMLLLMLGYLLKFVSPNSTASNATILWYYEGPDDPFQDEKSVMRAVLKFFFPKTCSPTPGQVENPCRRYEDLNVSECLRYNCCVSGFNNSTCLMPFIDPRVSSLQKKVKKMLKSLKWRRNKLKRYTEMYETLLDKEGDEEEQESGASLPY